MNISQRTASRAWDCLGNGALFSTRIRTSGIAAGRSHHVAAPTGLAGAVRQASSISRELASNARTSLLRPNLGAQQLATVSGQLRRLQTSRILREAQATKKTSEQDNNSAVKKRQFTEHDEEDETEGFGRTEKAAQASQLNLSARLSKEGDKGGSGAGEIWRLLRIAAPEWKTLGWAFLFLLISSSVTMSVPFSIGRILDVASKPAEDNATLLGMNMTTFYIAFATVLATGALANYGRIIILRIVGERIVTKLRS